MCSTYLTPGIVFEDAPSGIRSGRAAGCKVIALLTTHPREQVEAAQPDYIVKDLSWRVFQPYKAQVYSSEILFSITVQRTTTGVTVTIKTES